LRLVTMLALFQCSIHTRKGLVICPIATAPLMCVDD